MNKTGDSDQGLDGVKTCTDQAPCMCQWIKRPLTCAHGLDGLDYGKSLLSKDTV